MQFIKLTSTLKALDKDTLHQLTHYVASPYFKVSPAAGHLLQYLIYLKKEFTNKTLDPSAIAKKEPQLATPNKQTRAGNELQCATENFLAMQNWKQDSTAQEFNLLHAQKHLHLFNQAQDTHLKLDKKLVAVPEKNHEVFYHQHLLTEISFNGFAATEDNKTTNDITPVVETLDVFYALKKLRYHCEMICREQTLTIPYKPDNAEYLIATLQPYFTPQHSYVWLTLHTYHMLLATHFDTFYLHYLELKNTAQQQYPTYPIHLPDSVKETVSYALNASIMWSQKGYHQMGEEFLTWVDWYALHRILLDRGKINSILYKNTINRAVQHHRPAIYLRHFIDTYTPCLVDANKKGVVQFAEAMYLYQCGNLKLACQQFKEVSIHYDFKVLGTVRRWQFIVLYELNPHNTDALLDLIEKHLRFTQRNQADLLNFYDRHILFAKYGKLLIQANTRPLAKELLATLQGIPYFQLKEWFEEKLTLIINHK